MMTRIFKFRLIHLAQFVALFSCSLGANAATRTAYFDQTAVASATIGLGRDTTAKCRIIIRNPSNARQDVKLYVFASSTSTVAALQGASTPPSGFVAGTGSDAGAWTNSATITLNSGDAPAPYDFDYKVYPSGTTTGDQNLTCRGRIEATDTSTGTAGFVVANGFILSFAETSATQTMGAVDVTKTFKGNTVFTQIPISVNRGKPF